MKKKSVAKSAKIAPKAMSKTAPKIIAKPLVKKSIWPKIIARGNALMLIAVIVVNYLAVSLPIGGMTTGALSDLYPNIFVPAGITFSIRGLIYLLLIGFVVWQLIDVYSKKTKQISEKIGIWFLLSCVANISWIFAWHYKQVAVSVAIMLLFLIVLIVISKKINIGQKIGNRGDKLLVQTPFSIYLGRISVATIANVSTLLVNIGRDKRGMTDVFWTTIVIIVAALLAIISLLKYANIIFAAVVIWAFVGIIIKRLGADPVYISIIRTVGICIAIIATGIGASFKKWLKN